MVQHDEDPRSELSPGEPTSAALGISCLWQLQGSVGSLVRITEDEEKNKTNGWQKVTEHETRSMVNWECSCKWHLPTDYVERFNLMMPSDMW